MITQGKLNREQLEAHWCVFRHDWEMFMEGALYESIPTLAPWELLEYKVNAWHQHLDDSLTEQSPQ